MSDGRFWFAFLERCRSVSGIPLTAVLLKHDAVRCLSSRPDVLFWRILGDYGEPDLILKFEADGCPGLIVVIEAKLNAGKSGKDEREQLRRYAEGIEHRAAEFADDNYISFHPVVYLTARSSLLDLESSCIAAHVAGFDGSGRFYSVQWQDILEVAELYQSPSAYPNWLGEVADFLRVIRLERFRGFAIDLPENVKGAFLKNGYWRSRASMLKTFPEETDGSFYGR